MLLAQSIQQISEEALRVEQGSLYPALHRMEQLDWILAEWKIIENGRRAKYYRLTAFGRKQLAREEKEWNRMAGAVTKILRYAWGESDVAAETPANSVAPKGAGGGARGRTKASHRTENAG